MDMFLLELLIHYHVMDKYSWELLIHR